MGIVNIDADLHDQIRKACVVSCRSINAQAAFWIKIGMRPIPPPPVIKMALPVNIQLCA